jgi:hypothetical protein
MINSCTVILILQGIYIIFQNYDAGKIAFHKYNSFINVYITNIFSIKWDVELLTARTGLYVHS